MGFCLCFLVLVDGIVMVVRRKTSKISACLVEVHALVSFTARISTLPDDRIHKREPQNGATSSSDRILTSKQATATDRWLFQWVVVEIIDRLFFWRNVGRVVVCVRALQQRCIGSFLCPFSLIL